MDGMIGNFISKFVNKAIDKKIDIADLEKRLLEIEEHQQQIVDIDSIRQEIANTVNKSYSGIVNEINLIRTQLTNNNLSFSIESQNIETRLNKIKNEFDGFQEIILQSITSLTDVVDSMGNKKQECDKNDLVKVKNSFTTLLNDEKSRLIRQIDSVRNDNAKAIKEYEEKINVLMELITDKIADQQTLPDMLETVNCPFKKRKTVCEIWSSRKNKNDATVYCIPCMLSGTTAKKVSPKD